MKNENFLWEEDPVNDKSNPLWKDVAKSLWVDMPEFENPKQECYKRILVKFKTEEDYNLFCEKLDVTFHRKTRFTWFPKLKPQINFNKRWVSES